MESIRARFGVGPAVAAAAEEGPGAEDAIIAPGVGMAEPLPSRPDGPASYSFSRGFRRESGWEAVGVPRSGRSGGASSIFPVTAAAAAVSAWLATLMVGWGEVGRDFVRPGAGRPERAAGPGPVRQRLFRLGPPTNLNSRGAFTWGWGISVNVSDRLAAHTRKDKSWQAISSKR